MNRSRISGWSWSRIVSVIGGMACLLAPQVRGAQAAVSIVDFAFNPASVNIHVNDSVVWTWVGPTPHTTTSTTGLWDSGILASAGQQFTFTFTSSGTFPYFCTLHPFMTASVTVAPVGPSGADVGIALTAAPSPVAVSNQLTYAVVITNAGPANTADVVVTDSLPATVSFLNANVSQGTATQSVSGWRWDAGPLASGASATGLVVVLPLQPGTITNNVSVSNNDPAVTDPNPGNNSAAVATIVNSGGTTGPTNAVQVSSVTAIAFDRQTGLFEQSVELTNVGSNSVAGVRLAVLDLPPDVILYNASGASNGAPFVEYDQTLGPAANVNLALEYYRSNRLDFVSTNFQASAIAVAVTPGTPAGTVLQLDRAPFLSNGQLVIEFSSTPGVSYVIQYSADMQTWTAAVPAVIATSTAVQWIDAGPPKTDSPPGAPGQRFYRVVQSP